MSRKVQFIEGEFIEGDGTIKTFSQLRDEEEALLAQHYDGYEHGNGIHHKVYDLLAVEANQWAGKVSGTVEAFKKHFIEFLAKSLTKQFGSMTRRQAVEMERAACGTDRITTWVWKPGPQFKKSNHQQHSLFTAKE